MMVSEEVLCEKTLIGNRKYAELVTVINYRQNAEAIKRTCVKIVEGSH
jgi:hypothetical protein